MASGILSWILGYLAFIAGVLAQSSNVEDCISNYQWTINHRQQTPCLVAAFLESSCSTRGHEVNQIPPGTHYIGPDATDADLCSCNSITYSLIEACGLCQNRTQLIDYAAWTENCKNVNPIGQFPQEFPSQVEVPSWAALNISMTNSTFDPISAEREAMRSDFSSIIGTMPSTTVPGSPSSTTTLPRSSESLSSNDSGGLNAGGIAGVTIGALVVIIVILVLIFWMMIRARKRRNLRPMSIDSVHSPFDDKRATAPVPPGHVHSRSLSDPASIFTPFTYGPSVVSPSPLSPGSSTFHTAGPVRGSTEEVLSPQSAMTPRTIMTVQRTGSPTFPLGYTGVPEV